MKRFELIDISGDAGIRTFGHSLEDLFINAAAGMYSLIADPGSVVPKKSMEIKAEGVSRKGFWWPGSTSLFSISIPMGSSAGISIFIS